MIIGLIIERISSVKICNNVKHDSFKKMSKLLALYTRFGFPIFNAVIS